jgi:Sulfate permease and related transporters (MFS superfamily)
MSGPIPATGWLRAYERAWLRSDLVAGLTAAAVVVPQAMAYADIAGLPLAVGLYTALVPLVVYAVMGTSRPLSVTTTSTLAILTAGALHAIAPGAKDAQLGLCDRNARLSGGWHALDRIDPASRDCS